MENSDKFKQIIDEMYDLYLRKNHDYGDSFHKTFEAFGVIAPLIRISDKMERLKTLAKKEALVKDESMKDTLIDIANYSIMTVIEMENNLPDSKKDGGVISVF